MTTGALGILIWLPVLIALWVGVIGLAKAGRSGAWWSMLVGLGLVCLGIVGGVIGAVVMVRQVGAAPGTLSRFEVMQIVAMVSAAGAGLGVLLFSIGFAIHGFQSRRARERIVELETVVSAQNEQLARYQGGPKE